MFKKLRIEALVSAPVAKVWDLWTQPDHITRWNFANSDWCCPSAYNNLQPGGKYGARMEAKDGSFGFDFEAIYDEVTPYKKIAYTMSDGRTAVTEFEAVGDKTKVTTVFDAEKENSEEMQQSGWQAILDNFKIYAESN